MNCLTIAYPAGSGLTFNADYYRDHHLKTIMKLYDPSIERFELRDVPHFSSVMPIAFPTVIYGIG